MQTVNVPFKLNPVSCALLTLFISSSPVYAQITGVGTIVGSTSSIPSSGDWNDANNSVVIGYDDIRPAGGGEPSSLTLSGSAMTAKAVRAGGGYANSGNASKSGQNLRLILLNGSRLTLDTLGGLPRDYAFISSFSLNVSEQSQATVNHITGTMGLTVSDPGSILTSNDVNLGERSTLRLTDQGVLRSINPVQIGANSSLIINGVGGVIDAPEVILGQGTTASFSPTDSVYRFAPVISGAGGVEVSMDGTTVLLGKNTYSGETIVRRGTLAAGADNALSSNSDFSIVKDAVLDNGGFQASLLSMRNLGTMLVHDNLVEISGVYTGTSTGNLEVSGSRGVLQLDDSFDNSGNITVRDGALLRTAAIDPKNTGSFTIDGAGSRFEFRNYLNFGTTLITNGGAATGAFFKNNPGNLLVVQGANSALTVTNTNLSNDGTVQVLDGAHINAQFSQALANTGGMVVSGRGSTLSAGSIASTGTLLVNEGGTITAPLITLEGSGTSTPSSLNIGNVRGGVSDSAGTIDADLIQLKSAGNARALVNFNHTDSDSIFGASITGNGDVNVDAGTTVFTHQSDYTGTTTVNGGTLRAGSANAFSANSTYNIASGATLDMNGFSNTLGDTTNAGNINVAGTTAGAVLTVNGNYASNNGTLHLGTELGDDNATSDRFVVTGDVTGTTRVRVNNLGGSGAETLNGIQLISVQGNADSNAFVQQGRIVAGAYDYRLVRGDRDWFLTNRSDLESGNPVKPDPDNGGGDGDNGGGDGDNGGGDDGDNGEGDNGGGDDGDNGGDNGGGGQRVLRPEAGAYAANLATASSLFDTRMSDRQGTYYLDPVSGKSAYTSMWLRMSGDHNRVSAGGGQLSTRANSFVTMLGGDIAATDTTRLGLMAGYGNSKSNTRSKITGYGAKGQINGYTTGLYGTWFAEGTDEKGLWTDSTLQYSWFNNSVSGDDAASESYKSKGLSASLSAGYVIPLGSGERTAFFLQPQARVGWSGIKADDHIERNGTRVQGSGQDNVSTSLGVKAFMKGHSSLDDNTGRQFGLFTEVNWINNSKEYAVRMDNVAVSQSGSRNIAEARVGIDGGFGNGFGVKGSIGQQVGDKGWSDTAAAINFSYKF